MLHAVFFRPGLKFAFAHFFFRYYFSFF